ncbi:MAG: phosphoribosylformylglycinamidine synthase subunit PurS [Pseudomonadota bacterium]
MKAVVTLMLREGVLDPQGAAVAAALSTSGFEGVKGVRQGKILEIDLDDINVDAARARVADMCERLLANTVVESYRIEIEA